MAENVGISILLCAAQSGGTETFLTGATPLCKMDHAVHFRPIVRGRVHERSVHTPGEPSTVPRIGRCVLLIGSLLKRDPDGICLL